MFNLFDDVPLFTASSALGPEAARCPEMTVPLLTSVAALFPQILHDGRQKKIKIRSKKSVFYIIKEKQCY